METPASFFASHYRECLAAGVIVGRLADIGSTWLATPKLALEANPLARRLGWPFAWASLGLCVLPFAGDWGWAAAVPVIVASLFVAASNCSRALLPRTLGEAEYLAVLERAFSRASRPLGYGLIAVSSALVAAAGGLLMLFYPRAEEPAFQVGLGIVAYGAAIAVHGSAFARRMFRQAAERAQVRSAA
jgi:hypothetical protein